MILHVYKLGMHEPQKSAMAQYLEELRSLTTERERLNGRISKVEKVLRGMIDLLDTEEQQIEYLEKLDDITPPTGLTDAIFQVLLSDPNRDLFPTEIRDRLKKSLLMNHANEMASVHTTLKRLIKNNPMVEAVEKDGKTAYRIVTMGARMIREAQLMVGVAKPDHDFKPKLGVHQLFRQRGDRKK